MAAPESMSEHQRSVLAALEELRAADRVLAGIEASPRTGGQRTWEAFSTVAWWLRWPWGDWRYNDRFAYTSDDARAVNTELFEAQAMIARARERVGLSPEAVVEIPVEMEQLQALSDQGTVWTIFDDLALIRQLRGRVRELFERLRGEDPVLRAEVEPLADELEPGGAGGIELEQQPRGMSPARRVIVQTTVASVGVAMICASVIMGLIAGEPGVLVHLLALPFALYYAVRGLTVLAGRRDLPD